jgi:hypothetical protein
MNETWVSTFDAMILTGKNIRTRKEAFSSATFVPQINQKNRPENQGRLQVL